MNATAAETFRVPIPGGEIAVRVVGPENASETVVLIHGGPGLSCGYMLGLERLAQNGRRLVSYDQRGVGESTFDSDDPADWNLEAHDRDLSAVLDAIGSDRPHLLGHSWGGAVAMHFAAAHAEGIASLLLIDSCPPRASDVEAGYARFGERVGRLTQQGVIPAEMPDGPTERLWAVLPTYLADPSRAIPADVRDSLVIYPKAGEMSGLALDELDLTDGVARFSGPVLVLFGEGDPFGLEWMTAVTNAFAATQPQVVVLPDCGHIGWIECPDAFFAAVEAFLDAVA